MMIRFNHEAKDKLKTLMKGITKGYGTSEFNRGLTKSVGRCDCKSARKVPSERDCHVIFERHQNRDLEMLEGLSTPPKNSLSLSTKSVRKLTVHFRSSIVFWFLEDRSLVFHIR